PAVVVSAPIRVIDPARIDPAAPEGVPLTAVHRVDVPGGGLKRGVLVGPATLVRGAGPGLQAVAEDPDGVARLVRLAAAIGARRRRACANRAHAAEARLGVGCGRG